MASVYSQGPYSGKNLHGDKLRIGTTPGGRKYVGVRTKSGKKSVQIRGTGDRDFRKASGESDPMLNGKGMVNKGGGPRIQKQIKKGPTKSLKKAK